MIEVGTFEAKNRLSELLTQAERGEVVRITRRGVHVASLVPGSSEDKSVSAGEMTLVEQSRRLRANSKTGSESIKEMIEEGRR